MAVLLIAEMQGGALVHDATAKALTAAKALGPVTVLAASEGCEGEGATAAASLEGVEKVLCADDPILGHGLAEPIAALVAGIAGDYSHIVAPASTTGKNVMPRLAALLDVMVISDILEVVDADTFVRPIYAGNAIQTVKSADPIKVVTVRTAGFEAAGPQAAAPIERLDVPADPGLSSWIEDSLVASDRPELTSAKVVISGGRGLGSKENFGIFEEVAD